MDQNDRRTAVVRKTSNKEGPDEKKAKREDVHQNVLSCLPSFNNPKGHSFVNLSRENSLKQNDIKPLQKFNDFAKRGI